MYEGTPEPIRVALIDDQVVVREALSALLNDSGRASVVATFRHGESGFESLRASGAAAAVIAFDGQIHDPLATVARLRREYPELPLCAILGTGEVSRVHGALGAGCGGVLSGSATIEMMVAAIESLVDGQAYVDPNFGGPLLVAGFWRGNQWPRAKHRGR